MRTKLTVLFVFLFTAVSLGCSATTQALEPKSPRVRPIETEKAEKEESNLDTMWGGVITIDFKTEPPTVRAIRVSMATMQGAINGDRFSDGEVLEVLAAEKATYTYALPKTCGDTHIIALITILRTEDKRDVGFQMQPLGDKGCVLTPQATWWDDPFVRTLSEGREAYKFSLSEDMSLLVPPKDLDACAGMIQKTSH